jgi:6-phosphogluconolactonase/glucosamine-6-phosphate isomerase/deaminase
VLFVWLDEFAFSQSSKSFLIKNILKYFFKIHFIFNTNLLKLKKKHIKNNIIF